MQKLFLNSLPNTKRSRFTRLHLFANYVVLVTGLEPVRSISPRDFKSLVSAYSTTPAGIGDPDGNRTRVTAVKGRCLNRLTTGPFGSGNRT